MMCFIIEPHPTLSLYLLCVTLALCSTLCSWGLDLCAGSLRPMYLTQDP